MPISSATELSTVAMTPPPHEKTTGWSRATPGYWNNCLISETGLRVFSAVSRDGMGRLMLPGMLPPEKAAAGLASTI